MSSYISVNGTFASYSYVVNAVAFLAPGYTTTSASSDFSVINSSQISYSGVNKKINMRVRMTQTGSTTNWNPYLSLVLNATPSDITSGSLINSTIVNYPDNSVSSSFDQEGYLDLIASPGDLYIILLNNPGSTAAGVSSNFTVYIDILSYV